MLRKFFIVVLALAASLASTAQVFAQGTTNSGASGAVYILSNGSTGNQIQAYQRAKDGGLTSIGSFSTGGLGSGVGLTVPPDPLGSQNSIIVSPDGGWVFAVNAGSNDISVLKVTSSGLRLTDKVASSGIYPVSLTLYDDMLYVLNAGGDGSISGFKFDDGHLKPISNSTRSLNAATPQNGSQPNILEAPTQVSFNPDGSFLVVTDKGGVSGVGIIHVFSVSKGRPSAQPRNTQTAGPVPFSFTFDRYGHMIVVDAAQGTVTAYGINPNGSLAVLDSALTNQAATCWIAGNSRYVFTDNTGSGTLSSFQTSRSGKLTPVTANSVVVSSGPGTLPLDMGVSQDGQFVYSLETGIGQIGIFQANPDGTLTSRGTAGSFSPVSGFQGIAVY